MSYADVGVSIRLVRFDTTANERALRLAEWLAETQERFLGKLAMTK
jgi:hypothetical protein